MKKLSLFLSLLLCCVCYNSFANHNEIYGGYISYQSVGSGQYKISFYAYVSCGFGTSARMDTVKAVVSGNGSKYSHNLVKTDSVMIQDLCPNYTADCINYGLTSKVTYSAIIDFSAYAGCEFKIGIQYYGPLLRANTSSMGSPETFYVSALLNKCAGTNSSPLFYQEKHSNFAAMAGTLHFNPGARDADGDSLVYSFVNPMVDSTMNLTCCGASLPPFGNNVKIDSTSGQIRIIVGQPQQSTSGWPVWKVEEYRAGSKIGETRLDIQWRTFGASGIIPVLSGVNGGQLYNAYFCGNDSSCFSILSSDLNSGDSTYLSWDGSIAGAAFNVSNVRQKTATFCWKPDTTKIRSQPYIMTVKVRDNQRPYPSGSVYTYRLYVRKKVMFAAHVNKVMGPCGKTTFKANVSAGPGGSYLYEWSSSNGFNANGDSVVFTYPKNGNYPYTLRISSPLTCDTFIYKDTIKVNDYVEVNLGADREVCRNSSFSPGANIAYGKPPFVLNWSTGANGNPVQVNVGGSAMSIWVKVTDSNQCVVSDTMQVDLKPLTAIHAGSDSSLCKGFIRKLYGSPAGGTWSGGHISQDTFYANSNGNYTLNYSRTDSLGCLVSDAVAITVKSAPTISMTNKTIEVCKDVSWVNLYSKTGVSPASGVWSSADPNVHQCKDPLVSSPTYNQWNTPCLGASGQCIPLQYVFNDVNGCVSHDSICLTVNPLPVVQAMPDTFLCMNGSTISLQASPAGGSWSGPGVSGNHFNGNQAGSYPLKYDYTDANSCRNSDSTLIRIMGVDFSASVTTGMVPLSVSFSNASHAGYDSWLWEFGTGDTSHMKTPTYTYTMAGIFNVSLAAGSSQYHCTAKLDRSAYINALINSADEFAGHDFMVYPNPAKDRFYLELKHVSGRYDISLIDVQGREVRNFSADERLLHIPLNGLSAGTYLLKVSDNAGNSFRRLVVVH